VVGDEYLLVQFYCREVLIIVDRFTALRFMAIGAPAAARRIRILPTNQYAGWPIAFGIKEVINFVDCLMALCFTASSAVDAWKFVFDLLAVGVSYQLH
jgi:hypothetical protein